MILGFRVAGQSCSNFLTSTTFYECRGTLVGLGGRGGAPVTTGAKGSSWAVTQQGNQRSMGALAYGAAEHGLVSAAHTSPNNPKYHDIECGGFAY